MSDFDRLIGKTITAYSLNANRDMLTLETSDGQQYILDVFGDCCSISWIEHIDGEQALLGTIQSVSDIPMPDRGNIPTPFRPVVDEVSYYGLRIVTNKGYVVIDYRNDSNGYYGGYIELREA